MLETPIHDQGDAFGDKRKSGRLGSAWWLRHPEMALARRIDAFFGSVVALPRAFTARIVRDRSAVGGRPLSLGDPEAWVGFVGIHNLVVLIDESLHVDTTLLALERPKLVEVCDDKLLGIEQIDLVFDTEFSSMKLRDREHLVDRHDNGLETCSEVLSTLAHNRLARGCRHV